MDPSLRFDDGERDLNDVVVIMLFRNSARHQLCCQVYLRKIAYP